MIHLDIKYINLISHQLLKFKRKDQYLWTFRCPICGDSQKHKSKTRGNFFRHKGQMFFHCHNCNASMSFYQFLCDTNQDLSREYLKDKLVESNSNSTIYIPTKKELLYTSDPLKTLTPISMLSSRNKYHQYLRQRKIPDFFFDKLYLTDGFYKFINEHIEPGKFPDITHDEPRLIIPFWDRDKKLHALQGRSFDPKSTLKYITIVTNENIPKVYGLDRVNFNKPICVTEGPIDSMFLDNSIATAGGDLVSATRIFDSDKLTIIYDNEPRKPETVNKISKAIDLGYRVALLPPSFPKDINDAIISGLTKDKISSIITRHSYQGMVARLQFTQWRKI